MSVKFASLDHLPIHVSSPRIDKLNATIARQAKHIDRLDAASRSLQADLDGVSSDLDTTRDALASNAETIRLQAALIAELRATILRLNPLG